MSFKKDQLKEDISKTEIAIDAIYADMESLTNNVKYNQEKTYVKNSMLKIVKSLFWKKSEASVEASGQNQTPIFDSSDDLKSTVVGIKGKNFRVFHENFPSFIF